MSDPGAATTPPPTKPPPNHIETGKVIVQIVLGIGIVVLAIADLWLTPDSATVSPIVYTILGAIAGGPELLRLIRGGNL